MGDPEQSWPPKHKRFPPGVAEKASGCWRELVQLPTAQQLKASVPGQGLCILEPECKPLHCQRAVALLPAVVCRRPLRHVRQLPYPFSGAFSSLDHGELEIVRPEDV